MSAHDRPPTVAAAALEVLMDHQHRDGECSCGRPAPDPETWARHTRGRLAAAGTLRDPNETAKGRR